MRPDVGCPKELGSVCECRPYWCLRVVHCSGANMKSLSRLAAAQVVSSEGSYRTTPVHYGEDVFVKWLLRTLLLAWMGPPSILMY